jgi:hypothetical protein
MPGWFMIVGFASSFPARPCLNYFEDYTIAPRSHAVIAASGHLRTAATRNTGRQLVRGWDKHRGGQGKQGAAAAWLPRAPVGEGEDRWQGMSQTVSSARGVRACDMHFRFPGAIGLKRPWTCGQRHCPALAGPSAAARAPRKPTARTPRGQRLLHHLRGAGECGQAREGHRHRRLSRSTR